ncbi:MAG: alpha-galactosidase [Clostridia bacterium]|nr:alpha-galactosidase [Clostridia bacterium]
MAIVINEQNKTFTVSTKNSTYQMKVNCAGVLLHTYYGKKLGGEMDMSYSIKRDMVEDIPKYEAIKGDGQYSLVEVLPQELSCFGCGDYRDTALNLRHSDGSLGLQPIFHSVRTEKGKYNIPSLPAFYGDEGETLIVTLKDRVYDIFVHLYYGVFEETDVILRSMRIENKTDKPVTLEKALSLTLDFNYSEFDLITFYGRWASERDVQRVPVEHGSVQGFSTRGASGHITNPSCILCEREANEEYGNAYGFAFVYSGSFLISASKNYNNNSRIVIGINPENFSFELSPNDIFCTPEVAMTFSSCGFSKISHNFHKAIRNNLCRGQYKTARRPVLINNWEGTYFDFNADKLVSMAKDASELGVEMLVLDDGWFGKRNDDHTSLGDWYANENKLGCSLSELAERINETGMKFGIWFEPECISEDSDLYRAHPDYAFKMPGRKPTLYRQQLVLDMSRKEVRDNIFMQLCNILDNANISYIKWDFNRSITDLYSCELPKDKQGEIFHRYILGLYELLDRITSKYPNILFESCSSGGGRFDLGMHYYMPQAWVSDNTDPIDRLRIQGGTSFIYPVSTMGAHVSASPNHITGRITPLETRGLVAYFGTYGLELDINKMSSVEKEEIRRQIKEFKRFYELIQYGDYYRLISPYNANSLYCSWMVVKESEALLAVVKKQNRAKAADEVVRLKGLKHNAYYSINGEGKYLGEALMSLGLPIWTDNGDYTSKLYYIKQII